MSSIYPWCNAHLHVFPDCQQHSNRHRGMREPMCPVTYPLGHGTNRKGRWIESSPSSSPNKLNKVTELDKIVPLTFGPAVSALEAVTGWLCFCDSASGLWKKANCQLPSPCAGRGPGDALSRTGSGEMHTSKSFHFPLLWCYLGKHEPFQGRGDTVETIRHIFQATFPSPTILKKKLISYYWHLPFSTVKLHQNRAEEKGRQTLIASNMSFSRQFIFQNLLFHNTKTTQDLLTIKLTTELRINMCGTGCLSLWETQEKYWMSSFS